MAPTAQSMGFPTQVWLGIKSGEWPVEAFTSEETAKNWAAQGGNGHTTERVRYIVGPVPVDPTLLARKVRHIPATTAWVD